MERISKRDLTEVCRCSLMGIGLAIVVTVIMTLCFAVCVQNEYMRINTIRYCSVVTVFTGGAFGAILAGKLIKDYKVLACAFSCIGYYLILLIAGCLCFDIDGSKLGVPFLACCGAGFIGSFVANRRKKYKKGRGAHRRNR